MQYFIFSTLSCCCAGVLCLRCCYSVDAASRARLLYLPPLTCGGSEPLAASHWLHLPPIDVEGDYSTVHSPELTPAIHDIKKKSKCFAHRCAEHRYARIVLNKIVLLFGCRHSPARELNCRFWRGPASNSTNARRSRCTRKHKLRYVHATGWPSCKNFPKVHRIYLRFTKVVSAM